MRFVLVCFICMAVIGLTLSLVSHLCAWFEAPQPLGEAAWCLHIGIFVVWVPAIIAYHRLVRDFKQKEHWKASLRGCPRWLRWLTSFFFVYAIANFLLFAIAAPAGRRIPGAPAPPVVFRGFSGHWMAFYSAAVAILYSALVVRKHDPSRRCANGHPVAPSALYCETCGVFVGRPAYGESEEPVLADHQNRIDHH